MKRYFFQRNISSKSIFAIKQNYLYVTFFTVFQMCPQLVCPSRCKILRHTAYSHLDDIFAPVENFVKIVAFHNFLCRLIVDWIQLYACVSLGRASLQSGSKSHCFGDNDDQAVVAIADGDKYDIRLMLIMFISKLMTIIIRLLMMIRHFHL